MYMVNDNMSALWNMVSDNMFIMAKFLLMQWLCGVLTSFLSLNYWELTMTACSMGDIRWSAGVICLKRTTPTKESLLTCSNPLPAEGPLMTERGLTLVFTPGALMLPAASPPIIASLVLTLSLYSRGVPSSASSLPDM